MHFITKLYTIPVLWVGISRIHECHSLYFSRLDTLHEPALHVFQVFAIIKRVFHNYLYDYINQFLLFANWSYLSVLPSISKVSSCRIASSYRLSSLVTFFSDHKSLLLLNGDVYVKILQVSFCSPPALLCWKTRKYRTHHKQSL